MSERGLDISGEWMGVYSYPAALPPVAFSASLIERDGWLSGVIEEQGAKAEGAPKRRSASIQGRRVGLAATWLKCYEHRDVSHDVQYEGQVSADGEEISGRWSIVGNWSGTFLMARQSRATARRERRARARA
jgi:hypothetical protein